MKQTHPLHTYYLKMTCIFIVTIIIIHLGFISQARANETTLLPHSKLYQIVQKHLKQKIDQKLFNAKITVQPISKYIKLKTCTTPIQLTDRNPVKTTGRMTLKLSCDTPHWKIYISANIAGDLPVIISTQAILKGQIIQPNDVKKQLIPYQKVRRGSLINLDKVIGSRSKRSIAPNSILTVRLIQPPYLVFKNQQVTLQTHAGGITIETKGTALKSAVAQQQVDVRNNSSKKVIKGIVIAPNTVWVP